MLSKLKLTIFFAKAEIVITLHHCFSESYSIRMYFILDRLIKFSGQKKLYTRGVVLKVN